MVLFTVSVDMNDGEIMSVHRLEKSMAVRNESHVSLAILASAAVSPVSANQNLTAPHNATQSHNATVKPELRNVEEKEKRKTKKKKSKKEKKEKDVVKPKKPLAG